jgi:hypothetical protein
MVCLALLACKLANASPNLLQPATETPLPTDTAIPTLEPTPTAVPTETQAPLPTATYTPFPSPTTQPKDTKIPASATPGVTTLKVVNNLNQSLKLTLIGPITKGFQVNPHSSFTVEIEPGEYSYQMSATNFNPQSGKMTFPPGPFTWTWGKAKP